ncbi:MAG: aminopeptidase [Erysipelotrichaceae bacterium]
MNAWDKYLDNGLNDVMTFNEGYKSFLTKGKTERECVTITEQIAVDHGFKKLDEYIANNQPLKTGDKVYSINKGRNIVLFVIGEKPLVEGLNILGAHIDSPRLDLKQKPLYEDKDLVLFDTHYYGGVKKYQWVARPLALHGIVCKKDGSVVNVVIGEDPSDPVIGISDLLPHLAADQMQKPAHKVIEGEDLNALVGSIPSKDKDAKERVKQAILDLLKEKYDIEEDDFISSEFEIVPAEDARDYGLDRSMVMGYGHDDRVCAYTSLKAILDIDTPSRTACCILVDKEEVGSNGSTGMHSSYFSNVVLEMLALQGEGTELSLRRAMERSLMLSSDVSAAYDSNYPSVNEMKNTAFFGNGICINKYTGARGKSGCNDASPEFLAKIRAIFAEDDIMFQTAELGRVDQGGGGTIAYVLANLNMEVVDAGIAVQNMHAPSEVVSKVDVYESYRAYKTFLNKCK